MSKFNYNGRVVTAATKEQAVRKILAAQSRRAVGHCVDCKVSGKSIVTEYFTYRGKALKEKKVNGGSVILFRVEEEKANGRGDFSPVSNGSLGSYLVVSVKGGNSYCHLYSTQYAAEGFYNELSSGEATASCKCGRCVGRKVRASSSGDYSDKMIDLLDDGIVSAEKLAEDIIANWMSEDEVADFINTNGYDEGSEEELEEAKSTYETRCCTKWLIEQLENGILSYDDVARDGIKYFSEDRVHQYAVEEGYLEDEPEPEECAGCGDTFGERYSYDKVDDLSSYVSDKLDVNYTGDKDVMKEWSSYETMYKYGAVAPADGSFCEMCADDMVLKLIAGEAKAYVERKAAEKGVDVSVDGNVLTLSKDGYSAAVTMYAEEELKEENGVADVKVNNGDNDIYDDANVYVEDIVPNFLDYVEAKKEEDGKVESSARRSHASSRMPRESTSGVNADGVVTDKNLFKKAIKDMLVMDGRYESPKEVPQRVVDGYLHDLKMVNSEWVMDFMRRSGVSKAKELRDAEKLIAEGVDLDRVVWECRVLDNPPFLFTFDSKYGQLNLVWADS